jgi:hypothetical protein
VGEAPEDFAVFCRNQYARSSARSRCTSVTVMLPFAAAAPASRRYGLH